MRERTVYIHPSRWILVLVALTGFITGLAIGAAL
jgi:hypothetical protein